MRPEEFLKMLRDQKQIMEVAVKQVAAANHLSDYQRTRMCSELLREFSLSSRKIAMTLRRKARDTAKERASMADSSRIDSAPPCQPCLPQPAHLGTKL